MTLQTIGILLAAIIILFFVVNLPAFFLRNWVLNTKTIPAGIKCYIKSFKGTKRLTDGVKIIAIIFPKKEAPKGPFPVPLYVKVVKTPGTQEQKITLYTDKKKTVVLTICDLPYKDIVVETSFIKKKKTKLLMQWTFPNGVIFNYST